ncbi:ribonuclease H-like domain-containing protein [Tanacetum coccineum]
MSMLVQRHKFYKMAKFIKMAKRLCLVNDLKMLKITMSNTSSRNKLNPKINDHYNILTGECQKDELKTKDKASLCLIWIAKGCFMIALFTYGKAGQDVKIKKGTTGISGNIVFDELNTASWLLLLLVFINVAKYWLLLPLELMMPGPVTTEEKAQNKNDVKARSMLLMALPNEHLMTFNQYKDAQTLFAAIQTRFGGNKATKKTQKTLLKQMLQKIVSQLAILGENISQEDLNLKFLRSLPSERNTHVVVWKNKPDLDTMSFDDLYNNFKIVEQEVKGTASSSSSSSSQNMAFVSSPSSTNEVNTAYGVSSANTQVSPASTQLALLSMRTRRFFQKTGRKITINGSDTTGYDKSKVECFNCHKMGHFARECRGPRNQDSRNRNQDSSRRTINVEETSFKAMVAIDGAGFDWSC